MTNDYFKLACTYKSFEAASTVNTNMRQSKKERMLKCFNGRRLRCKQQLVATTCFALSLLFLSLGLGSATDRGQGSIDHITRDRILDEDFASRKLQNPDLNALNELLEGVILRIRKIYVDENVMGLDVKFNIDFLYCEDLVVGDVQSSYKMTDPNNLLVNLNVPQYSMNCRAPFNFSLGTLMQGEGELVGNTSNNSINATWNIQSLDERGFEFAVPGFAETESCNAYIGVDFFDISGEGVAGLEMFRDVIGDTISSEGSKALCNEIAKEGPRLITRFIQDDRLEEFLEATPLNQSDPLAAEESFLLNNPDLALINFGSDSNDISLESMGSSSSLVGILLKNAHKFLGIARNDPGSATGKDLAFNMLIRKQVLDENGSFSFDLKKNTSLGINSELLNMEGIFGKTKATLDTLRLKGIDTLAKFDPIAVIGNHTLQAELQWDSITIEADVLFDVKPSTSPVALVIGEPLNITERITISVDITNVKLNVSFFMAIDQRRFDEIQLGSVMDTANFIPCFLDAVHDSQISDIILSFDNISDPTFAGFESPGVDRVASRFLEAAVDGFGPTLVRTLPSLIQSKGKEVSGSKLLGSVSSDSDCVPPTMNGSSDVAIDFRDILLSSQNSILFGGSGSAQYGTIVHLLVDYINNNLLAGNPLMGVAAINEQLIEPITELKTGVPGSFKLNRDLFTSGRRINPLGARLDFRVYDPYVENLNTVGIPSFVLKPVEKQPHILNNSFSMGVHRPLKMGLRLNFTLTEFDGTRKENDMDINMSLDSVRLLLTSLIKVSQDAFMGFPIGDILDYSCWLATILPPELDAWGSRVPSSDEILSITAFNMSASRFFFNVSCNTCSDDAIDSLSEHLLAPEASEAVNDLGNRMFGYISDLVRGEFVSDFMARMVIDARKKCPHRPEYDPNFKETKYKSLDVEGDTDSSSFIIAIFIIFATVVVLVMFISLFLKAYSSRRHRIWVQTLSSRQVISVRKLQDSEKEDEEALNKNTLSMFRSRIVPKWLRLTMPLIVIGNIGFFLSGHLNLGASVSILASVDGESFFRKDGFFEFSMAKSTIDMWNVGAKELAMLVFALSIFWPYTKQLITLYLWFASPNRVSVSRRGNTLLWLDFLAKWSMCDIFVLVITIVGFRISVQSPKTSYIPADFYQLDLVVIPKWGLYANMTAQLISQISSHFIIYYHRQIVLVAKEERKKNNPGVKDVEIDTTLEVSLDCIECRPIEPTHEERLCNHGFQRPHRGESEKVTARRFVTPTLATISTITCALVVLGCAFPSFSLEVVGILGVVVEAGQKFMDAETDYSVFSCLTLLFDQARLTGGAKDYIGLSSLSILLVSSVLLVPIAQSICLVIQWFAPLNKSKRMRLTLLLEVLQAWQYTEVYMLSLLISSWQLGPISELMINPYCRKMKDFLTSLSYYGILNEDDSQCYRADVSLQPAFFFLFFASMLLAFMNTVVMKAAAQYFRELDAEKSCYRISAGDDCLVNNLCDSKYDTELEVERKRIQIAPILFTDRFRWLLLHDRVSMYNIRASTASSVSSEEKEGKDIAIGTTDYATSFACYSQAESDMNKEGQDSDVTDNNIETNSEEEAVDDAKLSLDVSSSERPFETCRLDI